MEDLALLERLACSLGIGLLMGLERQREPSAYAGMRTFALVAMFGSVCAWIAQQTNASWILPAGLLAVASMIIGAYVARPRIDDPGTTTTAALLLCYGLGIMAWWGQMHLAVGLAIAATALLHFKEELHGFAVRLTREEILAVLRLVMVSALILPVLPDRGYGPYAALNPYRIWLMVVLISGLGFAGYLFLQFLGSRRAVGILGVLGGLVSSTATTLGFARQARLEPSRTSLAAAVILIANLTALARLTILALVMCPTVLPRLLPVFAVGIVAGAFALRREPWPQVGDAPQPPLRNPGELRSALAFGAMFAVVQVMVAWLEAWAGDTGVFVAAGVSGLTDLDAIALAVFDHAQKGRLTPDVAVYALLVAYFANLLFKLGVVAVVAGPALALRVGKGFAAAGAGLLLATLPGLL